MTRIGPRALAVSAVLLVGLACGDVPTLDSGIAYMSPVILPSLAVAANDVLRDSLGNVAPLSVQAFDRNDQPITGITPTYIVTTLPPGVSIDANGNVTAFDSVRTVQIVARVGDRLQTVPVTLEVVAQPDSLAATGTIDSLTAGQASSALQVTVTGNRYGTRVNVNAILVRYRISAIYPARAIDPTLVFFANGLRTDLTQAVDTTKNGLASRAITLISTTGIDSIAVQASANTLLGKPLTPVRFVVPIKKGG